MREIKEELPHEEDDGPPTTMLFITAIFMIVLISSILFFAVQRLWTLGDNPEDYDIICLGNHEYWRANFMNKGLLAIALDDSGKPILCEGK